jgi:hypothetical protein
LAANDLFFVVLSDEPIPTNLDLMVTYGQFDGSTKTRARPITLPVQLTVMKTPLGRYRFQFDKKTGTGRLQPL